MFSRRPAYVFTRHCADAVLSFANRKTLVGDVSPVLIDFTCGWIQTPSNYDVLVAKTMTPSWVAIHQPVISRHNGTPKGEHTLFTEYGAGYPDGQIALCPKRCGRPMVHKAGDTNVRVRCSECKTTARVPKFTTGRTTILAAVDIVPVPFPRPIFSVSWVSGKSEQADLVVASMSRPKLRKTGGPSAVRPAAHSVPTVTSKSMSLPLQIPTRPAVARDPPVELPSTLTIPTAMTSKSMSLPLQIPTRPAVARDPPVELPSTLTIPTAMTSKSRSLPGQTPTHPTAARDPPVEIASTRTPPTIKTSKSRSLPVQTPIHPAVAKNPPAEIASKVTPTTITTSKSRSLPIQTHTHRAVARNPPVEIASKTKSTTSTPSITRSASLTTSVTNDPRPLVKHTAQHTPVPVPGPSISENSSGRVVLRIPAGPSRSSSSSRMPDTDASETASPVDSTPSSTIRRKRSATKSTPEPTSKKQR